MLEHGQKEDEAGDHRPEQHLLEHSHGSDDSWFAASRELVQLHVGRDEGSREFGVGSSACATAADVFRDVMDLVRIALD